MRAKARLDLSGIGNNFAGRPSHVDATAELIKFVRYLADRACVAFGVRAVLERPSVDQRNSGIEQVWPDVLGRPYLANSVGIAAHRVEIVVRNKILEGPSRISRWRSNNRGIQAFEPIQRFHYLVRELFPARGAGNQGLEEPRGRRRPDATAVITAVVKADAKEKSGHGSGRCLRLLLLLLIQFLQIVLGQFLLEGDAPILSHTKLVRRGFGVIERNGR